MPTIKIEADETRINAASSKLGLAAFELEVSEEDLAAYLAWVDSGRTDVEWFEPGMIGEVA